MTKITIFFGVNFFWFGFLQASETVEENSNPLIFSGLAFLVALVFLYLSKKSFSTNEYPSAGFLVITPGKENKFYPLSEEDVSMKSVADELADKSTNIYSNLNKITLSVKANSVLLEDKNFKNSILINRRRNRRTVLQDGDILDMGELTLMYVDPQRRNKKQPHQNRAGKQQTKLLSNIPSLVPLDGRKKTVFLSRNITFIGRSDVNDIVTKVKSVSLRHAKIERVAGRHKIVDFGSENGTFVNGRRVDEYYLRDGDEVSFDSLKYKFQAHSNR